MDQIEIWELQSKMCAYQGENGIEYRIIIEFGPCQKGLYQQQ